MERIKQLEALVNSDPGNALFRYTLGMEYLKAGEHANAAAALREAIRIDANYSAAYRELGKSLEKTGQAEEAARVYQTGIEAANRQGDIQTAKEMEVFLKRIRKRSGRR
ncbi:MAG: tetratricopeptide repeat protein [Calditrichaceae bacterium]|nr:tetratricopeptide repeat protein [Calditrichia bacterium]NUQ42753.1 tetratricopeptide repeat protein [Calditrichaceae bacterium]